MFLNLGHQLAKGETCGDGRRGNALFECQQNGSWPPTYFPWWRLDWFPFTWAVRYRAYLRSRVAEIPQTCFSGWVVTWFLLGYTVRMFKYTVRTFWSNVGKFLYIFSSIPRKLYTIFQPTFSPIKRYQNSIFKLLTLSTNSVKNVVRLAYFQIQAGSSPLKILWQSLYSK